MQDAAYGNPLEKDGKIPGDLPRTEKNRHLQVHTTQKSSVKNLWLTLTRATSISSLGRKMKKEGSTKTMNPTNFLDPNKIPFRLVENPDQLTRWREYILWEASLARSFDGEYRG